MRTDNPHLPDQDLLLAADGELSAARAKEVQEHLASCWTCRTRLAEIEHTIAEFVKSRAARVPELASAVPARTLLQLRMAELAAASSFPSWFPVRIEPRLLALAGSGVLGILIAVFLAHSPAPAEVRAIPDPKLTPGATLPVTRADICASDSVETRRIVPASVARLVFTEYGIDRPKPRAYEVDYLITPALGGSDNIRNFWPQPYANTIWNAHIKDALEDHLRGLVCTGQIDLQTAQDDIARDWIAAYKKYFSTEKPLPKHSSFLKTRPGSSAGFFFLESEAQAQLHLPHGVSPW